MPKHLWASLALLALAAVGCGGGGAPSKKEYIADLNKVCENTSKKIQKVKAPRTIKGFGTFARETRPILKESIRQAEDLELPDEKGKEFKAYVEGSKRSLGELDALEKAAATGDGVAVRRVLTRTAAGSVKRQAQASQLGLKRCGIS